MGRDQAKPPVETFDTSEVLELLAELAKATPPQCEYVPKPNAMPEGEDEIHSKD